VSKLLQTKVNHLRRDKVLRIAMVGAGTMGQVHSNSYINIKGGKLIAICDIQEEKAKKLADIHCAAYYVNFDEMLKNEDIDVVDICLPTYMHKEFVLKSIENNKNVFCEKPIALNVGDAEEMVESAREKGVKFSVGHVVRFFPAYEAAIRTIESGKIGTPKLIRTTRTGSYPSWGWRDWYGNYDLSGGPLLDLIIHDFDWIRHNFGDVERVYAKSLGNRKHGQDHCLVTLRLKNGAIVHSEGSWAYPSGSMFGTTFEIVGTDGQIEYDSRESSPIKKHIKDKEGSKIVMESPLPADEEPYTKEIQEFIDSIIEGRKPKISGEDAIKALKISLAAIESSKTGEAVVIGGGK
jgi:predicted dehydrogenase